jgi:hypothetical protein
MNIRTKACTYSRIVKDSQNKNQLVILGNILLESKHKHNQKHEQAFYKENFISQQMYTHFTLKLVMLSYYPAFSLKINVHCNHAVLDFQEFWLLAQRKKTNAKLSLLIFMIKVHK